MANNLELRTVPARVSVGRALAESELVLVGGDLGRDGEGDLPLEEPVTLA